MSNWITKLLWGTPSGIKLTGCSRKQERSETTTNVKRKADEAKEQKPLPKCNEVYAPAMQPAMRAAGKCK